MIDRSKFQGTSVDTMKSNSGTSNDQKKADYLTIEPGLNQFRFFPYHPDPDGGSFFQEFNHYWLKVPNKDGELKSKKIFDARFHGGTRDIIHEYIELGKKLKTAGLVDKKQIELATSIFDNWKTGLKKKTTYVAYAIKFTPEGKVFGVLEFSYAIKIKLDENADMFTSGVGPMVMEPYSPVDSNLLINVKYNKGSQDKTNTYVVTPFQDKRAVLSNEDLALFMEYPTLKSRFQNRYTRRDFELALKGLQIWDRDRNAGIFNTPEFIQIMKEISVLYPKSESKTNNTSTNVATEAPVQQTQPVSANNAQTANTNQVPVNTQNVGSTASVQSTQEEKDLPFDPDPVSNTNDSDSIMEDVNSIIDSL